MTEKIIALHKHNCFRMCFQAPIPWGCSVKQTWNYIIHCKHYCQGSLANSEHNEMDVALQPELLYLNIWCLLLSSLKKKKNCLLAQCRTQSAPRLYLTVAPHLLRWIRQLQRLNMLHNATRKDNCKRKVNRAIHQWQLPVMCLLEKLDVLAIPHCGVSFHFHWNHRTCLANWFWQVLCVVARRGSLANLYNYQQ